MTTLLFIRGFFVFISGIVGYQIGSIGNTPTLGLAIGVASALLLVLLESNSRQASTRGLSSMVFGLLLGMFMAKLLSDVLTLLPLGNVLQPIFRVIFTLVFSYVGAVMAMRGKDEFNLIIPYVRFKRQDVKDGVVLLDTSAIIDGRIGDIFKTGFLGGRLVVPRFVLQELQKLSDSDDEVKRQRGRRGLEILKNLQKDSAADIRIHEDDLTGPEPVDLKLAKLARVMEARICTLDFNLSRMASLQGIEMLNINDLINAVKPMIFNGEELTIRLLKEGKDPNQAVGYLEDGTMVVVIDGKKVIGQEVKVYVTSALQTQAGRMVFAKLERS